MVIGHRPKIQVLLKSRVSLAAVTDSGLFNRVNWSRFIPFGELI